MNKELVPLEGFHAIKHAFRFGAEITDIIATRDSPWLKLALSLAPDLIGHLNRSVRIVSNAEFSHRHQRIHPTGIAALAKYPIYYNNYEGDSKRATPAILLENPRRLGNVGAVVRVAAATNASAVFTTGSLDPWDAEAIRGSAGLHFAVPVIQIQDFNGLLGPIIVMDAEGKNIKTAKIPSNAILAFGTEREGVSDTLREHADQIIALPMRPGVSSLNLATSVAATMYVLAAL